MKSFSLARFESTGQLKNCLAERTNHVNNIMGKEGNADYQNILFFSQCFPKPLSSRSLNLRKVLLNSKKV